MSHMYASYYDNTFNFIILTKVVLSRLGLSLSLLKFFGMISLFYKYVYLEVFHLWNVNGFIW